MRKIKLVDTVHKIEPISKMPVSITITRTPSALDSFQVEEYETGKDSKVVFITSDISVLFNQQRLASLNPMVIQQMADNMKRAKPDLKLSDEQLFGALKSRYIQSNADLYAWSRSVQSDLANEIAALEASQVESEPAPEPAPASE